MDPGSSAAATSTLYGAIALVVIALVPFLRDLISVFRAWIEHRWKDTPASAPEPDSNADDDVYVEKDLSPDVVWLNREVARLERELAHARRELDRSDGEVEQLRGEVEFLVDQLQEAVQERDEALAREARLRKERRRP